MGNWQPTADDRLTDASFRRYHAGENTGAATRLPRVYCAHIRLLSMVAEARRIKPGPRTPVRQNDNPFENIAETADKTKHAKRGGKATHYLQTSVALRI